MNRLYYIISLALLVSFSSCGKKDQSLASLNEDSVVDSDKPMSIIIDSITYYNGNQNKIELKYSQYFGFVFEADQQNLIWEMEPKMDNDIAYVSESYVPEIDTESKKSNGKQYFTFMTLKSGKGKLTFITKDKKQKKTIHINII